MVYSLANDIVNTFVNKKVKGKTIETPRSKFLYNSGMLVIRKSLIFASPILKAAAGAVL
jgi:hypothetical protein